LAAQNLSRGHCREGCHGGSQFALQPASAKFVECAKLQAALRQRSVQLPAGKWQYACRCLQTVAFEGADLQPQGFEFRIHTMTHFDLVLFLFWTKN
jgi:hypothetical protein